MLILDVFNLSLSENYATDLITEEIFSLVEEILVSESSSHIKQNIVELLTQGSAKNLKQSTIRYLIRRGLFPDFILK